MKTKIENCNNMWYKVRFGVTRDDQQANYEVNSESEARACWEKSLSNNGKNRIFSISRL